MQSAETFTPSWINGLPASLLAPEGKTVTVISLMQRTAGLNRERRKALEGRFGQWIEAPTWALDLSRTDWSVLSHYLNGKFRFYGFWFVAGSLKAYIGKERYAHAVEIQLLAAYDVDWNRQTLDESALTATCPHWPSIREGIVSMPNIRAGGLPLSVFMLWFRLLDDLRRFDTLDAARQRQVSHAVFALASVGRAEWFIDEAIRICPSLESDLGAPARHRRLQDEAPSTQGEVVASVARGPEIQASKKVSETAGFQLQVKRLIALADELNTSPTREAIRELVELSVAMERVSHALPMRTASEIDELTARRTELRELLRSLTTQSSYEWLDEGLLQQLDARWSLAFARDDEKGIRRLIDDAGKALERINGAASTYVMACEEVAVAASAVCTLDRELAAATTFSQRNILQRSRAEAMQRQVDAEKRHHICQEEVVHAASPFGEVFEFETDYVGSLRDGAPDARPSGDSTSHLLEMTESQASSPREVNDQVDRLPEEEDEPKFENPVATEAVAEAAATVASLAAIDYVVTSTPADAELAQPSLGEIDGETGVVCVSAVVWDCLGQAEPGLAYHAARWIAEVRPGTRLPSIPLLAATALAEALMVPDGAIDTALRFNFEQFESGDFSNVTRGVWHTSTNLLLAASTLRPMILAPNSGASSVAAYLHHDGHYPALYSLVQRLRELSAKLVGFRIDPIVLRRARGEAATRSELEALQLTARDWLGTQAPAYTIRFKPATDVWKQWLKPGGSIESIVTPVIQNCTHDARRVRDALLNLDEANVRQLVHDTDRRILRRRKGEDIHASALDHLVRLVDEALTIPRQWLALVDLLGSGGSRLRSLLEEVNVAIRAAKVDVERELTRIPGDDHLGMVAVSQKQAMKALYGLSSLFEDANGLQESEPAPAEVLGRACLLVPDIVVSDGFSVDTNSDAAIAALEATCGVLDAPTAQRLRVERGDMLGAELLVTSGLVDADLISLRQERERWKAALRREIEACREAVDIGSAYGYLQEAERTDIETHLARYESGIDGERRIDIALSHIDRMRAQVAERREVRKRDVDLALQELLVTKEMEGTLKEAKRALAGGDIATANELLYWLRQGTAAPSDLDDGAHEGFDAFFPDAMKAIDQWLESTKSSAVPQHIQDGTAIPGASGERVDGAQRKKLAVTFQQWLEMKSVGSAEGGRLEGILKSVGIDVHNLARASQGAGREVWTLDAAPIDRQVCTVPTFGSAAAGRFQIICAWGRPREDDLLQWVGDVSVSRPVMLLYFGRMTERRWRELGRTSKAKRRSFLLLDETLLVYLAGVAGSRLRAWFEAALPFSYASPYDPTAGLVPPEMFYGRSRELDAVSSPDGRCFIYGGRQLGKTALLKRVEQSFHKPGDGHFARWIDLRAEGIGGSLAAGELWVTLHERFRHMGIIDSKVPAPTPGKKQGSERVIRAIREFLDANADRRVLLLLDEADRFFEQDGRNDFEETRRLKQLMDETNRRFKVVFAGLHNVLRMTERANHPLAHFGTPIEIGPLKGEADVKDAANLIRRPMAAAGFKFESNGLVIRILAQTNYYPSLIQLYCSHLLRHMLEKVTESRSTRVGPRYTVTDRDIEQVYASDDLREDIRQKFRLTLQLDPRYEVLANAMALSLLRAEYSQTDGMPWQVIREACALRWWPEGFQDTSESDFRVLLDEMKGLGVLGRAAEGRYVLRSANVLLLLGTQDEIEMVLNKEREPMVEFESSSFRPPMRAFPYKAPRSVFTYQQLSQFLQRKNFITVVTGTEAAGIDLVVPHLRDYLGNGEMPTTIADCADRASFGSRLQAVLADRTKEQSIVVVPESMPWTDLWLKDAQLRLNQLRSDNRLVSLIFIAEPATLWRLLQDGENGAGQDLAWMSLMHWNDGFLRHWLEECQLPLEPDERGRLAKASGLWPSLIGERVGERPTLRVLRERLDSVPPWLGDATGRQVWRSKFGLDVAEPSLVLESLALWKDPLSADEIAEFGDFTLAHVQLSLRWAELLGLAKRDGAANWTVDPVVASVLAGTSD